jgi:hypothetical protein
MVSHTLFRPATTIAGGIYSPYTPMQSHDVTSDMFPPFPIRSRHNMFAKFQPSKISPRFVEQSLDQLESWFTINGVTDDNEKFLLLKLSIEPETYQKMATTIPRKSINILP